jgi:hypothetical protein
MGSRLSGTRTVIFTFAGRRKNMELQLPCIKRILKAHPETEYHIWDLSQTDADHQWLQSISGRRITVYDEFYGDESWKWFNEVYRFYTHEWFKGYRFVKLDEDVVFLQDKRFGSMLAAIDANPGSFITARVVNNVGCTESVVEQQLSTPLRDGHLSADYAMLCHQYMFDNWHEIIDRPIALMEMDRWLSINAIGYNYEMGCQIASMVGQQPPPNAYIDMGYVPREIMTRMADGRPFAMILGDEGVVNLFPRLMLHGFAACHLYFGPQRKLMSDSDIADLRKRYAEMGREYAS